MMSFKNIYFFTGFLSISIVLISLYSIVQYTHRFAVYKFYDAGLYQEILDLYSDETSPEMLHNLGNTSYMQWRNNEFENISLLEEALLFYSGSLQKEHNIATQYNYDYVRELLDMLQEKQNQQQENSLSSDQDISKNQQDSKDSSSQEDTQQEQENSDSREKNDQNIQQSQRGEQYMLEEEEEIGELSEEEQDYLEEETENLKEEQMYNQQYFGKQRSMGEDINDVFDNFFGIPNDEEKDW